MVTEGERQFEAFCRTRGIIVRRLKERTGRTPDFEIELGQLIVAVEAKDIEPTPEDRGLLEEIRNGRAVAHYENMGRVRQSIFDAAKQLRAYGKNRLPTLAVMYDSVGGLFGYVDAASIAYCLYGPEQVHFAIQTDRDRTEPPRLLGGSRGGGRVATKTHNTSLSAVGVLRAGAHGDSLSIFHNVHAAIPLHPQQLRVDAVRHFVFRSEQPELMPRWVEV